MKKSTSTNAKRRQMVRFAGSIAFSSLALGKLVPRARAASSYPSNPLIILPSELLFFNGSTGTLLAGKVNPDGTFTTDATYPEQSFEPGWTDMVMLGNDVIFLYNSETGEGGTVRVNSEGKVTSYHYYSPESFDKGATQVTPFGSGSLLLYDRYNGSTTVANVNEVGVVTSKQNSPSEGKGAFVPGWTHIVTCSRQ